MKFLSNFRENISLRKERNTFENKYHTVQDKYVSLLESKFDQTKELENCKILCQDQKKTIKKQKMKIADLEMKVSKLSQRRK